MSSFIENSMKYLKGVVQNELRPPLQDVCFTVLDDRRFAEACGSAGKHHCYCGGLAVHTAEVMKYALGMTDMFPKIDREVVIVAALFHDYMKVQEYLPNQIGAGAYSDGEPVRIGKTLYRNLVRHVAGSHAEFILALYSHDSSEIPDDMTLQIEHAILAHHGRNEWGSPIEPQTLEAQIIHFADMLSQRYGEGSRPSSRRFR